MFKRMIYTAACAALLSTTTAHADPNHYTVTGVLATGSVAEDKWTDGQAITLSLAANLTASGINAGMSGSTIVVDILKVNNASTDSDITLNGPFNCSVISTFFLRCQTTFTPRQSDIGASFRPIVTVSDYTGTKEVTSQTTVTYAEPPYDDIQRATVWANLDTHGDGKIHEAGDVIRFNFAISDIQKAIPAGDYVRIDVITADVNRHDGTNISNYDFGLTCTPVGAGVPVGGDLSCAGAYTVSQADVDTGGIRIALDAAFRTSSFNLGEGILMESFEVVKEETPEPETPTACNRPMTPPADGAKFVFRYPVMSAACS